jgi:tripartite-type tricarboxylate transporter receptor subunit TctC
MTKTEGLCLPLVERLFHLRWHVAAAALAVAGMLPGSAATAEVNFESDRLSIVIPYRPGGGFDVTVRAFAPFFARQLGEGVFVLPENIPGAGGRRGAATVYRAQPDGTTLGIFNLPGFVLPEIMGERVAYDLRKLSWIGRLEAQNYLLLVAAKSSIRSIGDLQAEKEISFLSTGYGSTVLAASQIAAIELDLMKKDPIFLAGYAGTADCLVGLMRGDGNVALAPVSSATKYLQSGDLRAIAVTGEVSEVAGVATFAELGFPVLSLLNLQRSIAGPPDMDAGLLAELRAAFARAVADPEFQRAAAIARLDLRPLDGDAAAAEVDESFLFYERFKADLGNPNALL